LANHIHRNNKCIETKDDGYGCFAGEVIVIEKIAPLGDPIEVKLKVTS